MFDPEQHNSEPPTWLRWFVNDCARGLSHRGFTAPIGCHYFYDQATETWEISLFVSRTEICGGASDGKRVPSGLGVDVMAVSAAFDVPPLVYWQAEKLSKEDELGTHLSFEGTARGLKVWLRVLQHAPEWTSAGRLVHSDTGDVEDLW